LYNRSRKQACKRQISDRVEVKNSVVLESSIDNDTKVGPFAYVRPGSVIGKNVKIGDFVEIKKSVIGDKTKISHLTYVEMPKSEKMSTLDAEL